MTTAAIALAGGGLRCAAQVWWCEELLPAMISNRVDLKMLVGSSGGAINAAKLAEGETDNELLVALEELSSVWRTIDRTGSEKIFPVGGLAMITHIFGKALLDGSTLWGLVNGSSFGNKALNVAKIASSKRQLDIFVTNKITRKKEVISNRDPTIQNNPALITKAVVASASRHPFFPPVVIDGVPYGDGEDISFGRIFQADCDFIFVLCPNVKDYVETAGDDFFSRRFQIAVEAFIDLSNKTQKAEEKEIARALEIVRDMEALETLRRNERSRFWTPFGKRGVDKRFGSTPFSFQGKKKPIIIQVHLENQPSTLQMHHCQKGDLRAIRGPCREQMRKILRDEGFV